MIDFEKAFPQRGECDAIILAEKGGGFYTHLVKQFNFAKEATVSVKALTENEIKGLELMRDNNKPEYVQITSDGINLHPLFFQGWQSAILGKVFISPDCFKDCPEIKEQITAKYNETGTPPGYFENFAQLSYIEVAYGWACAKFYYWLKEGAKNEDVETYKETKTNLVGLPAKCTKSDLIFIASKLVDLHILKLSDQPNFIRCLQPIILTDWQPIQWEGSNPELATLIYILIGIDPKPEIINRLFSTNTKYDSQSTKRIENKRMKELIRVALK